MPTSTDSSPPPHATSVPALVLLLRLQDIAIDDRQLTHQYGQNIGVREMLRCARDLKLKARAIDSTWERLARTTFPAIAERRDGSFFIICKVANETVLIHDPAVGRPQSLDRATFEAEWNGRLVLMARRAGLGELARRFDVTWFLQAMHKYRRLLTEVLVASFFLQLFALVSPLFFQVVIDKVLTHRGLSTLDVIVFGLIVVSLFESVLTAIRTYVFSHTTNRIDVELGAYVAIERVTGALNGLSGSFVLQHSGTISRRGIPTLTVSVVPDSGTGALKGIAGTMMINIADGKHFYVFDYTLGDGA
jgi:ATP-binding cassette, subfamily B, bacterial HlyB/CyaB